MNLPNPETIRVAIFAGGISNEREISLLSGEQVRTALESVGYQCEMLDPADVSTLMKRLADNPFDVAYLALHGKGGEDGSIQGLCETIGLPYTGSGVLASALGMDKSRSKMIYRAYGIPTAPSITIRQGENYDLQVIVGAVGDKSVVKPIGDGSSVGMSIVHNPSELDPALHIAFATGQDVLVESFIEGTEVTVAVLGNEDPQPLPVIEIVPHAEFYDYEVKYSATGADHIIPARLPEEVFQKVQAYAVRAHKALGCRGMSRSDFIIDENGECWILETNTIPGMTKTSLLPDAAASAGYDFPTLCQMILALALESSASDE